MPLTVTERKGGGLVMLKRMQVGFVAVQRVWR